MRCLNSVALYLLFAAKGSRKASLSAKVSRVRSEAASDVPSAWPGRAVVEEVKKTNGPKPISLIGSTGSIGTQVGKNLIRHCCVRSLFAVSLGLVG